MAELFVTGHVVDCILLLMLVEFIALLLLRGRLRWNIPAVQLLIALGAGAALLLALRAALVRSPWQWIALWLIVALGMHLIDLNLRWMSRRSVTVH